MKLIALILVWILTIQAIISLPLIIIHVAYIENSLGTEEKFLMLWSTTIYVIAYFGCFHGVWDEVNSGWVALGILFFYPLAIFVLQLTVIAPALYWIYDLIFVSG